MKMTQYSGYIELIVKVPFNLDLSGSLDDQAMKLEHYLEEETNLALKTLKKLDIVGDVEYNDTECNAEVFNTRYEGDYDYI